MVVWDAGARRERVAMKPDHGHGCNGHARDGHGSNALGSTHTGAMGTCAVETACYMHKHPFAHWCKAHEGRCNAI
jgi:hypothetical protein